MVVFHRYFLSLRAFLKNFIFKIQYSKEKYNRNYKKFRIVFFEKVSYNGCRSYGVNQKII